MFKAFLLGALIALDLILGGRAVVSRPQQTIAKQIQDKKDLELYQSRLADATPVEAGQLTDRQHKHSKLFASYKERRHGKTMGDLVAQASGPYRSGQITFLVGLGPVAKSDTPERYLGALAEKSDAVIRGKVLRKISQLTEDDSFIFTDYEVVVSEIFKNNYKSRLELGATIVVTRPGGTVLLKDVVLKAVDESYAPFPLDTNEVVLFLQFIPETGAYRTPKGPDSFEINGPAIRPLSQILLPPGVLTDADSFLRVLRTRLIK